MLVGLYNWIGDKIPEPEIADSLEFTSIYEGPSFINKSTIQSAISRDLDENDYEHYIHLLETVTPPRVETCCCLDWKCLNGIRADEVFTYLGRDEKFDRGLPEFFNTDFSAYRFAHSVPFDTMLADRFDQLLT